MAMFRIISLNASCRSTAHALQESRDGLSPLADRLDHERDHVGLHGRDLAAEPLSGVCLVQRTEGVASHLAQHGLVGNRAGAVPRAVPAARPTGGKPGPGDGAGSTGLRAQAGLAPPSRAAAAWRHLPGGYSSICTRFSSVPMPWMLQAILSPAAR